MRYPDWMTLAEREYQRIAALLADLSDDDWSRPTDCAGWLVRDVVAHLTGAAEATASVREQLRQQRIGRAEQGDGDRMDAVNALQVRERSALSPAALLQGLEDASRRGIRARRRLPAALRVARFPFPPPLGWASLGYLNGPIYTRDAWMHRLDICRAADRAPEVTADHDGRIVADLVREWSAGDEPDLLLTGPAGGSFGRAGTGPYDAIDFCRALAGRGGLDSVEPAVALF